MIRYLLGVVLLGTVLLCISNILFGGDARTGSFPKPKQQSTLQERVSLQGAQLNVDPIVQEQFPAALTSLHSTLGEEGNGIAVHIQVLPDNADTIFPEKVSEALSHAESYWLSVSAESIRIVGADPPGALHGLTRLEQMARMADRRQLATGEILDWPDHRMRALHMVARNVAPKTIYRLIDEARAAGMNALIIQLADGVRLNSLVKVAREDAWSRETLQDIAIYAQQNGLQIIPELKLLTHQQNLLKDAYPQLMFNRLTYDPQNPAVYDTVLPVIDEVVDLLKPTAVHIGHDEAIGWNRRHMKKKLAPGEGMLPSEDFLASVNYLHAYLSQMGIETWMWGDMLIAPDEFPEMLDRHLHGGANGYAQIRSKIPKDVVICDWHYFDKQPEFPSSQAFAASGHKVLGATWKNAETTQNFSRYIANMPANGEGMIATTWFHVQRQEWDLVSNIIKTSGEAFWNAK